MKALKIIGKILFALITILMFCSIISLIYFKTFGADKVPTGVTSTYVTTMTDPLTNKTYNALEANYYANLNGKGYEAIEFLINAYSGVGKQTIYSRGFQLVWDKEGKLVKYTDPATGKEYDYFEYNRNNSNQSFITGHKYEFGDHMFVDINKKTYAVALDGTYTVTTQKNSAWNLLKIIVSPGISLLYEGFNPNKEESTTHKYSFYDLLLKMKEIIKSSSNGTGEYVIPLIDLGDFLHVYDVNDDGQISGESIGAGTLQNSYFTVQTHYDTRGLMFANQSIFGSVAGNSSFNISGLETVDYWQARHEIKITEKDLVARYSDTEQGNYYYLNKDTIKKINQYENCELEIYIDLDNLDSPIGFDYNAFKNIRIKSFKLLGTNYTITLLPGALANTGITSSDIVKNALIEIIDKSQEVIV